MGMSKRQLSRIELEADIYRYVKQGMKDSEIAELLNCTIERVQNVRQRNGISPLKPREKHFSRVDDFLPEEKQIVGVPCIIKGKRYIDVTGDIIDCGNVYKDGKSW